MDDFLLFEGLGRVEDVLGDGGTLDLAELGMPSSWDLFRKLRNCGNPSKPEPPPESFV